MRLPRLTARRLLLAAGVATLALGQAGSTTYRRYLRCQVKADELAASEGVYRQKAGACEELAPRLREVAALAREMARSASGDFERSKWLEMARSEEQKADAADREAVRLMTRADQFAGRSNAVSRLAWRPWLAEPK